MDKITDRLNLFILLAEAFIPSTATALLPSPMFSARNSHEDPNILLAKSHLQKPENSNL